MKIKLTKALMLAILAAVPGLTASCGDCAGVGRPAVDVTVRDVQTGAGIGIGATLYLFKPPALQPVETFVGIDSLHLIAGWDDSGIFDVVVEKAGYYPWTAERVSVEEHCSTETAFLQALLRRRQP